eukprot:15172238-Alexandrium_andersonii.AAC.1
MGRQPPRARTGGCVGANPGEGRTTSGCAALTGKKCSSVAASHLSSSPQSVACAEGRRCHSAQAPRSCRATSHLVANRSEPGYWNFQQMRGG